MSFQYWMKTILLNGTHLAVSAVGYKPVGCTVRLPASAGAINGRCSPVRGKEPYLEAGGRGGRWELGVGGLASRVSDACRELKPMPESPTEWTLSRSLMTHKCGGQLTTNVHRRSLRQFTRFQLVFGGDQNGSFWHFTIVQRVMQIVGASAVLSEQEAQGE